jgi:hypothetical protein
VGHNEILFTRVLGIPEVRQAKNVSGITMGRLKKTTMRASGSRLVHTFSGVGRSKRSLKVRWYLSCSVGEAGSEPTRFNITGILIGHQKPKMQRLTGTIRGSARVAKVPAHRLGH